jgi:hypothetical protein
VYVGLGQTEVQNRRYLRSAWEKGYTQLFTSLHVPETDRQVFRREMPKLLAFARELGYRVTADVSPATGNIFGLKLETLGDLGVTAIRFDWGYDVKPMIAFLQESALDVELNASTVSPETLDELLSAGIDPGRLRGGHNFYPRPETGLSEEFLVKRSLPFLQRGMSVSAFIPGRSCRRGPIGAGLPTLEEHRAWKARAAAKHLRALGVVSNILFGDPLASEMELAEVAALPVDAVTLDVMFSGAMTEQEKSLFVDIPHTNRLDTAALCIRSTFGRKPGTDAWPGRPAPRPRGTLTVDNEKYGRYAGEIQISLQDLPADERVNVVGSVAEADLRFLEHIGPGRLFYVREAAT